MLAHHFEARGEQDGDYPGHDYQQHRTRSELEYSRVFCIVAECISSMQQSHTVDILDITLLEVQPERVLLSQEVNRVQCFGLSFGDGWDVGVAFLRPIAGEVASGVLDDNVFTVFEV